MIIDPEARRFVESQRVGRLATADERGRPHVVPICFALDGATLYTPIDEKPKAGDYTRLRRLRSIAVNPHVQVLLDLYDDADWSCLRYVQLRGTARVIDGGEEHTRAIALLRARHEQYVAMKLDARPVIAVDVERVVQWSAAHGSASRKTLDSDNTEGLP
ncbi:MAG: TIGR03668 family PPOX class F420-dependent oxidoreductase [Chloroflexota bacterium]|nr:TIGR03668 family PPOX class F420-dependent oxidoreductase [Chloroflexota bacterium]